MRQYAYVGCRTTIERNARGKGIKVYDVKLDTGEWKEIQLIEGVENPSYMCVDQREKYLYVVHGDTFSVSSYEIDQVSGKLAFINKINTVGRNPVFVTIDKSNKYIYVAALQGGCVTTHLRNEDGSISDAIDEVHLPGKFDDTRANAHQCYWDKSMNFLFVPAQGRETGYGEVNVYRVKDNGRLELTQCLRVRELDEPRHITIHPNNQFAYIINEKNNSVTTYTFDSNRGILTPVQIVSTLPETYVEEGQASGILVDQSGKWLYASNRIHDSIAVFRINEHTGFLSKIDHTPTLGLTPRFLCFMNDGKNLLVANEDSDDIRIFEIQNESGVLKYSDIKIDTESPVCVVFKDKISS